MDNPLNPQDCPVIELNDSLWLTEAPVAMAALYSRREI